MKKCYKSILAILCAAVSLLSLSACGSKSAIEPKSTLLSSPKDVTTISYSERQSDRVKTVAGSAEKFSADFASVAYKAYDKNTNFAVAPVSAYMALSLAAQCADGNTRTEILSTLGITYNQLIDGFYDYYRSLFAEYKSDDKQIGTISLSNSIWLDSHLQEKQDCIDILSDKFNCYSYKVEFYEDNASANLAIRQFVKDKTRGLIDRNFDLTKKTLFALINTLYIKDVWNTLGEDLSFTEDLYSFANNDSTESNTKLLQGYYREGRVYKGENYQTFFTTTANGNKIKFILPEEGFAVDDIFTADNLSEVNSINNYNSVDEVKKIIYHTRCLFPEFSAEYNNDIKELLLDMGINDLFSEYDCNYATLTDGKAYCSAVTHVTKLNVDKTGIEGAAVTILENDGTAVPPEKEYEDKYEDFIIDRAFGFILSDMYDNTLFSGVVKKV